MDDAAACPAIRAGTAVSGAGSPAPSGSAPAGEQRFERDAGMTPSPGTAGRVVGRRFEQADDAWVPQPAQ